jgi:hypothetical protein
MTNNSRISLIIFEPFLLMPVIAQEGEEMRRTDEAAR